MPASITIITSGPLSQNPRPLKEALTLSTSGYVVTVIYPCFNPEQHILDRLLCGNASRLQLCPLFQTRTFTQRIATALARKTIPFGLELPSALGPYRALLAASLRHPADLTILHNEAPQQLAPKLLQQRRRIAADFEDWYSEDLLPSARKHRPLQLLRSIEKHLLHQTAYTSTTSHALAEALVKQHGGNAPEVIFNTFPLQSRPRDNASAAKPVSLLWFSQTIGPGRGLEDFLRAWALTTAPSQLTLIGKAIAGYETELSSLLPPSHRAHLKIVVAVSPDKLPDEIARHDIGLALEPNQPANKNLTISNKLFQYLNAGLAIIATPTAGQREVFQHDPSIGLLDDLSSPTVLAARLDALISSPNQLSAMCAASRRLAEHVYCWEKTAPVLLTAVERALARPS